MSYISKGQGYTYGVKTLSELVSLSNESVGDTAYCTTNNRIMTFDGKAWVCDDIVVVLNRSGVTINQWDIVIVDSGGTTTIASCNRTTTSGNPLVIGVAVYSSNANTDCYIAIKGNYKVNTAVTAIALGDDLITSTIAGRAQRNTAAFSKGVFGFATSTAPSGGGTVDCIIMPRKEYN